MSEEIEDIEMSVGFGSVKLVKNWVGIDHGIFGDGKAIYVTLKLPFSLFPPDASKINAEFQSICESLLAAYNTALLNES